jgi:hypothetical protein
MSEWRDISTAPEGQLIDVWVWELGEDGKPCDGFRLTDVRLCDAGDPTLIEMMTAEDEGWRDYYPHENGQWASHWMPKPESPPLPERES